MNHTSGLPHPARAGHATPAAGAPSPLGGPQPRPEVLFPLIGDEVMFQRSPDHEPELGIVRARSFGTRRIDVIDMNAKPLALRLGQYQAVRP